MENDSGGYLKYHFRPYIFKLLDLGHFHVAANIRLVIFSMVALLVSLSVIMAIGIRYTNVHIQQVIGTDDIIVNLYEIRILNSEYVANPSERVKQQWQTKYAQISGKLIKQPRLPDAVKDALDGLQQTFERLTSLPDPVPGKEASQKRLRNQIAATLTLESQRIIDWASDISGQTKGEIVPNLLLTGAVMFSVILFAMLVVITVMLITTSHILSSVNRLKEGAAEIAGGRLGFQVEQAGNDEIATLASEINQMSRGLMESYENLEERTVLLEKEIEERKRAEGALRESEQRYRTLIENANDIIFITDATGHFTFLNSAGTRIAGYDEKEIIGKEYWSVVRPDMREDAIKFFGRQFVKGVQNTYSEYPIITKDGREIWLEQNTSLLFEDGNVAGFHAMARDITDRKQTEKQLEDTLERLRKAFGATVQVMASVVEARDPYTAGHQTRSADLARAIAIEMGLAQEKIEGIRISGSIHDIGKLSIPAEILSKPTKLSELEFSLIKEHASRGFQMLKDVESPWSLAEIVYQHHERMDGSGYPRSLKGEEICIEARILTVADVVEAMASHRPYRPGLGIDAALNEIEKNRGVFYDGAVADACLRLFREKGFTLEGT